MTSDSDAESSNVEPQNSTETLTDGQSSTTSSPTDVKESSTTKDVTKETEKAVEKDSTTEHSIHQTVQLKTSEIIMETLNLEQTTKKVTLDFTTSDKVETEVEVNLKTTEDLSESTTLSLNGVSTELPLTTTKPDKASGESLRKMDELSEQTTQMLDEEGLETTTAFLDLKKPTDNLSQTSERISVTLTNAVTASVKAHKDSTSTTTALSSEPSSSTTMQPFTQSTTSEEVRESKVLNETNEATTLQWTTEHNNNWTVESSSSTVSTTSLTTENPTTTDSSDTTTTIQEETSTETLIPSTDEEGVRKINLRTNSISNDQPKTNTSNSLTLTQELVSNEGVKSTLTINVKPVTDSSSESDEELEVDAVTQPEEEIKLCKSDVCRKEGEESSKENEY